MVRHTLLLICLIGLLSPASAVEPPDSDAAAAPGTPVNDDFAFKSRALFDGQTLMGWEGDAYWFRADPDQNAIVAGRLSEKIPHNQFLCTTSRFGDFELRLEAKLVGEGNNAGVQIRSKRVPGETEVSGYQADIGWMNKDGRSVWGALYDESRRRKFLAEPDKKISADLVKKDDWNSLRVICEGPRIRIFVNGTQTIDYTEADDSIDQVGVIGLQVHSGKPLEAWYRNVRILSR